jgi:protein-disulfide isomerase
VLDKYPDDLKVVVKQFPLSNHRFAFKAAMAALAANNQGKFWEFHKMLLENHNAINDEKILSIAKDLKLDLARFNADIKSPANRALVLIDHQEGQRIGVEGTPSVFINGKQVNNRQLGSLFRLVAQELASLKQTLQK